eukprot:1160347-Pelagomonas_calceolata.AAC.3
MDMLGVESWVAPALSGAATTLKELSVQVSRATARGCLVCETCTVSEGHSCLLELLRLCPSCSSSSSDIGLLQRAARHMLTSQ